MLFVIQNNNIFNGVFLSLISVLSDWNPWWFEEKTLNELSGFERNGYDLVIDSLNLKEVTVLTGVRRSGKSTLMYQMIKKLIEKKINPKRIFFVNFEDESLSNISIEEIFNEFKEKVNPNEKSFIFFDEVHRKENWEKWVRKKYDLKTEEKIVVSGSCSHLLRREYSSLLTGRIVSFEIMPLNFKEFLTFSKINFDKQMFVKGLIQNKTKFKILNLLNTFLKQGGFPEIFFKKNKKQKKLVLMNYFEDIIFKDIVERFDVKSKKPKELAKYLLTNFTKKASLRNIRNNLGLSYNQIEQFFNFYFEAFLFFELHHFSYSLKEQKTRARKIYCIDNGLRNSVAFNFSKNEGQLVENTVFLELKKRKKEIYYWKNKNEVDFIIKKPNNTLEAINVCYSNTIPERELKGLKEFKKQFPKTKKLIIITKNLEKKEKQIQFTPLWKWLLK